MAKRDEPAATTNLDDEIADLLGEPRREKKARKMPVGKKATRKTTSRKKVSVSKLRYTPPARSVKRTPELEQSILERVAAGESLRSVCDTKGMPHASTVRYWAVTDPDFGERFKIARMVQAHEVVDLMTEELDRPPVTVDGKVDHGEVQLRRLRVDTYKWILAKMLPKVYGDRIALAGDPDAPLKGEMTD